MSARLFATRRLCIYAATMTRSTMMKNYFSRQCCAVEIQQLTPNSLLHSRYWPPLNRLNLSEPVSSFQRLRCIARPYSKKAKESKKESSKKGRSDKVPVTLSPEDLAAVINFEAIKAQMGQTVEHLKKEYAEQLTVRTSIGTLDSIAVETPDGTFPLIQLGAVVQKNPQLLMINLTATPQHITHVKLAVANAGLNPQQDGTTLFVPIPKVTREHREMLAKTAKTICDKTKDKLRNIQNTHVRELKKAKDEHSEDLIFNLQEALLGTTRDFMEQAEQVMLSKQKELLRN